MRNGGRNIHRYATRKEQTENIIIGVVNTDTITGIANTNYCGVPEETWGNGGNHGQALAWPWSDRLEL